jgi:putative ABC transport system permease protein
VLRPALRDLQWRRRRFAIAGLGTALVFGMALVITGVSSGFDAEASRTVSGLGVKVWVVEKGASGPFLGSSPMAASRVTEVANLPGITRAVDTVFTRKDIVRGGSATPVNVFGAVAVTLGLPVTSQGHPPTRPGEIAISTKLPGFGIGSRLILAGHRFTVVGTVSNATALAGVPNVYLTLRDAQLVAFAGQPVASAIAVAGTVPTRLPPGLVALSNQAARDDLVRALTQARSSIALLAVLLWIVAAMIVGSVIYVSVLERQQDFAVFKATGVSSKSILGGLAIQAVVLSIAAAAIGSGIAAVLAPNFPMPVSLTLRAYLLLPVIAVVVGLAASLSGLRRAVSIDPALAFGGP